MSQLALDLIRQAKREGWKSLDLGRTGLTDDNIPDELFELTELEELRLSNNVYCYNKGDWTESPNQGFSNTLNHIPSKILKLKKLRKLYAGGDFLSHWDISDVSLLGNMESLEVLYLRDNRIADISFLEGMSNLKSIYFRSNNISDISFLKKMNNIQLLDLSDNEKITDFSALQGMINLETLDLSYADITDISFLTEMKNMKILHLHKIEKIGDFSVLKSLKKLRRLNLTYSNISNISFLKEIRTIHTLDLGGNKRIKDFLILKEIKSLKYLNLGDNKQVEDFSFIREIKGLKHLDLRGNNISNISFLKELINLNFLDISENDISDISALENINNLQTLYLTYNNISNIYPLRKMNLKTLHIAENRDLRDCSVLGKIKSLNSLTINDSGISDISFLEKLENLKILNLNHNLHIKDFSVLKRLKKLHTLELRMSAPSDISFLQELTDLQVLNLSMNEKIEDFSVLEKMHKLRSIDLSASSFSNFSPVLHLVRKGLPVKFRLNIFGLNGIHIERCATITPPIGIVQQGNKAIVDYFEEIGKWGTVANDTMKLIVVGNTTVGKTSLIEYLINEYFEPNQFESTHGIEIRNWKIENININIWDFGGQEYYHASHRLFFSENAVYIVLWNEDTNKTGRINIYDKTKKVEVFQNIFRYEHWLETVRFFSGMSSIFVVQNKSQKHVNIPDNINYRYRLDIEKEFHLCIKKANDYQTNKTGYKRWWNDYDSFKEALTNTLQSEIVKHELISHWIPIRDAIYKSEAKILSMKEFKQLCRDAVPQNISIHFDLLIAYLRDIASMILYYPDDTELSDKVFLKARWISDTIYKVLDKSVLEKILLT